MEYKRKQEAIGFTVTSGGKYLGIRHSLQAAKRSLPAHRKANPNDRGPFKITGPDGKEWVSRFATITPPGKASFTRVEWDEVKQRKH